MNLVELAKLFKGNALTDEEFTSYLADIEIFEVIESTDELEDSVYFNGDKNSFFEVRMLVYGAGMEVEHGRTYVDFVKKVRQVKNKLS